MANIPISSLPEVTTVADNDYLAVDDGTTSSKIKVGKFNEAAAGTAQAYAEAAAASATAAEGYKNDAQTAKSETQNLITSAQTLVSDASTYAGNAQTSANNASTYASNASNSASAASTSASQASSYAAGVSGYATEAKSWAQGGTGTRSGEDTDNAKYYSNLAHTYEQDASSAATAAAGSASDASDYKTAAGNSATSASSDASSASTNALKAEGYAVGKQGGVDVDSSSPYYQANAKYYKEQAADSASTATTKASDASGYASAASGSASAASTSKEDSEAWAVGKRGGVDVPSTDPAYHNNAKYYADQAGGAVSGVSTWNARSGNVVPADHDYAANQVDYDNTTSGLTATDTQAAIDEVYGALSTLENGLGTAAAKDVPTSGDASTTQVVMGDDSRLTDARTPVSHTHTKSEITDFPTLGTAAAKNSTNVVTQSSTDLVESGAVYTEVSSLNTAIANKQPKTLDTPLTIGGSSQTLVESALGALNTEDGKAYKTSDTAETTIDDADYVPFYDTSATAQRKSLWSNIKSVLKTYFDTLYATITAVSNTYKVTSIEVSTSNWTQDTTSQSGTTLYKKSISLNHVYVDSPTVDIGAVSGSVLPTTAQQTAYDLLQYVTVDGTTLYLYASDTPTDAFYINVEGVD